MESIIAQLKEARLHAGLSLEELQERTLIPLKHLEYLEALEFDKIGPSVYIKGFIRRYAQEVGIDPDSLWQVESYHTPLAEPIRPGRTKVAWRNVGVPILRTVAIIAVLAIAAVLVYKAVLYLKGSELPLPPEPPPAEQTDPTPEPEPEPEPQPAPEIKINTIKNDSSEAIYSVENASQIEVVLEFSGKCWTLVHADENKIAEKTFTAGQDYTVTAAKNIRIRFGAPARATVSINGLPIEIPKVLKGFNLEVQLVMPGD